MHSDDVWMITKDFEDLDLVHLKRDLEALHLLLVNVLDCYFLLWVSLERAEINFTE
jgi:hypothetical protein